MINTKNENFISKTKLHRCLGRQVTCYNRSGHHVSGAEYDNKSEYDGIRQKFVPTIERKGDGVIIGTTLKKPLFMRVSRA